MHTVARQRTSRGPSSPVGAFPVDATFAFVPLNRAIECMSLEARPIQGYGLGYGKGQDQGMIQWHGIQGHGIQGQGIQGQGMMKSRSAPSLSALESLESLTDVAACIATPGEVDTDGNSELSSILESANRRIRDTQEFVRYYADRRRRRFQRMLESIRA